MNRRFVGVLVFALAVSAAASALVYHFVLANLRSASSSVKTYKHLVASHDLVAGTLIQATDLQSVQSADTPSVQMVNDQADAVGRGVIATIYEGEPISSGRLASKGAGAGLAAMIPLGMRAAALRVNDVVGVAGFVVPGMRVDVVISGNGNSEPSRNGMLSRTILQNIEVLSAGQKIEKRVDGKPEDVQVVNLLVTPDQAEMLSLASDQTKIQLVLRNPLDTKEQVTHGTSVAALFGQSVLASPVRTPGPRAPRQFAPVAALKKEPDAPTVEVFSGTKRSEQVLTGH